MKISLQKNWTPIQVENSMQFLWFRNSGKPRHPSHAGQVLARLLLPPRHKWQEEDSLNLCIGREVELWPSFTALSKGHLLLLELVVRFRTRNGKDFPAAGKKDPLRS